MLHPLQSCILNECLIIQSLQPMTLFMHVYIASYNVFGQINYVLEHKIFVDITQH